MKFILNFIFFGLLFYVISRFLPDTFNTLVGWVGQVFDFLQNLVMWAVDQIKTVGHKPPT